MVQNLRLLLRNQVSGPVKAAAAARAEVAEGGWISKGVGPIDSFEAFRGRLGSFWPSRTHERGFELYERLSQPLPTSQAALGKRPLGQHAPQAAVSDFSGSLILNTFLPC